MFGQARSGLVSGLHDIAVMPTSNIADQQGLAYETLLRSPRRLWLPARHRLLERETVMLSDVAEEPYIMLTVDEESSTAQRYWYRAGLRPRIFSAPRRSRRSALSSQAAWV